LVNYLIRNRRPVSPSSATALLYEEQTPRLTSRPPAASIQNHQKEARQLTVQLVSFAIFLSGKLFNLKRRADFPTHATALLYKIQTPHHMPCPPVTST
jgi:hypothetical protein